MESLMITQDYFAGGESLERCHNAEPLSRDSTCQYVLKDCSKANLI